MPPAAGGLHHSEPGPVWRETPVWPGAEPETPWDPFSLGSQSFQQTEDSGGSLKTGDSVERPVTLAFRVFSKSNLHGAPVLRAATASHLGVAVAPGGPGGPSPGRSAGTASWTTPLTTWLHHRAFSSAISRCCVCLLPPLPLSWQC